MCCVLCFGFGVFLGFVVLVFWCFCFYFVVCCLFFVVILLGGSIGCGCGLCFFLVLFGLGVLFSDVGGFGLSVF